MRGLATLILSAKKSYATRMVGRLGFACVLVCFGAFLPVALLASPAAAQSMPPFITVPPGYKIDLFAHVPKARSLVPVKKLGVIFVGQRGPQIHAIVDEDRDGRPEQVLQLFHNLKVANGIDWRDGWFYVAEQHRITRYRAGSLGELIANRARPEILFEGLPDDPWHGWRYARMGPDGMLYVAVGAPCNICKVSGLEGTIIRLAPTGGKPEIYARGVRNSVGFDFQPGTGQLYFTDNGADNMGDDVPPDELNHAPRSGGWFGFPWFGGGTDRTNDFQGRPLPAPHIPPVVKFGAHVASLGISFYQGIQFPADARGDAFVAHHGSWNRSVPDGYRVARVRFDKQTKRATGWEVFAGGFLRPDGSTWGRPVDVKQHWDGSLLISDDARGAVYRITYSGS